MSVVKNERNTFGISYWRTPRTLTIDLGGRSLCVRIPFRGY